MPTFTLPALPDLSPATPVLWRGRVWTGVEDAALEDGAVLTRGGRIEAVGPAGRLTVPDDTVTVQTGGTILPGLIDLHVHARPGYLPWFVAAGVTTMRDACNSLETVAALLTPAGLAPRVLPSGPLLDGPATVFRKFGSGAVHEPGDGQERSAGALIVRTPAQAERAVAFLADQGVTHLKLYETLAPDVYAAATRAAARLDLPVMTDLGLLTTRGRAAQVDARQALALGVRSVEHASGFALAATRAGLDPAGDLPTALLDELAALTVAAGAALVPTLSVFAPLTTDTLPDQRDLPLAGQGGPLRESLDGQWRAVHAGTRPIRALARADGRLAAQLAVRIARLGGRVGAGTDTPAGAFTLPGGSLHAELERLVRAGLTPTQALRAATGTAADILGRADLGRAQPGAVADLLVVAGDPTADVRATRDVRLVVQGGRPLTPATLRAALEA